MSRHFNKLTAAQDEALALLAEECAEVIHAVTKIQRHGFHSTHPVSSVPNVESLQKELGDVLAAIAIVKANTVVEQGAIDEARSNKLDVVAEFLHHAKVPKA